MAISSMRLYMCLELRFSDGLCIAIIIILTKAERGALGVAKLQQISRWVSAGTEARSRPDIGDCQQ
jgi:hypothetical protein